MQQSNRTRNLLGAYPEYAEDFELIEQLGFRRPMVPNGFREIICSINRDPGFLQPGEYH